MLVRGLLDGIGRKLVAGIVKACMFNIRRSLICFPAQVFFDMLAMDRVVSLSLLRTVLGMTERGGAMEGPCGHVSRWDTA